MSGTFTDDDEYVPAEDPLAPLDAANGDAPLPNANWQARVRQLEDDQIRIYGGVFTTNAARNGVMAGKERSHVPVMELLEDSFVARSVRVTVEHVMATSKAATDAGAGDAAASDAGDAGAARAPDHTITTVYLRADVGGQNLVVGLWEFAPDAPAPPVVRFVLPPGATNVVAYASCTLHGLWRSDPLAG